MNEGEHYWQDRGMDYRARPMECQFCGRNYLKPCGANEFDRCGNFLHLQTKQISAAQREDDAAIFDDAPRSRKITRGKS